VQGAQGSAGQGAGPILSLTYDYYCSNLKDGKLFDKLPFGYSLEEERKEGVNSPHFPQRLIIPQSKRNFYIF
jgi:hypothetical protein